MARLTDNKSKNGRRKLTERGRTCLERQSGTMIGCLSSYPFMRYWQRGEDQGERTLLNRSLPNRSLLNRSRLSDCASNRSRKYLTFEVDNGGFNNVRLGFENAVALAHALGRVLVLPPRRHIYLMPGEWRGMEDFYSVELLSSQLDVLTLEDFFALEADRPCGRLSNSPPPTEVRGTDRTINLPSTSHARLLSYLRAHGTYPGWRPGGHCLLVGSAVAWQRESDEEAFCAGRMPVRDTDALRREWLLHFPLIYGDSRGELFWARLAMAPFYTFIRHALWRSQQRMLRFMRDRLRYHDALQCAAGSIVQFLRSKGGGSFSSVHIRRGDFGKEGAKGDAFCIPSFWNESAAGAG
eukprot:7381276-Prymnesium_polylepis.3